MYKCILLASNRSGINTYLSAYFYKIHILFFKKKVLNINNLRIGIMLYRF